MTVLIPMSQQIALAVALHVFGYDAAADCHLGEECRAASDAQALHGDPCPPWCLLCTHMWDNPECEPGKEVN